MCQIREVKSWQLFHRIPGLHLPRGNGNEPWEITDLATPKTVTRFQRFISFINFYHQLIKDFTKWSPNSWNYWKRGCLNITTVWMPTTHLSTSELDLGSLYSSTKRGWSSCSVTHPTYTEGTNHTPAPSKCHHLLWLLPAAIPEWGPFLGEHVVSCC